VMDVWSRKCVAAQVFAEESDELAAGLIARACEREGVAEWARVCPNVRGAEVRRWPSASRRT
jgi:hypothetical protein